MILESVYDYFLVFGRVECFYEIRDFFDIIFESVDSVERVMCVSYYRINDVMVMVFLVYFDKD